MRLFLVISVFFMFCGICVAQDSGEEAIILNQEMNFLKADAENPEVFLPQTMTAENTATSGQELNDKEKPDLEQFFFGTEDRVQTRAAGPRRRAADD